MKVKLIFKVFLMFCVVLLLFFVFSCSREIDGLEFVDFFIGGEVFIDGFLGGL